MKVLNTAKLGEKKNMCLPGCLIDIPTVTEKDEEDICDFGLKYNIDMIALSFTSFPLSLIFRKSVRYRIRARYFGPKRLKHKNHLKNREPRRARKFRLNPLSDRRYNGGPWRSRHGDPSSKGFRGLKMDDQKMPGGR